MSDPALAYVPVHHTGAPAPDFTPAHHAGGAQEYRSAPVRTISSPAVDAAVIEGRARGYSDGLAIAREQAAADKAARDAQHQAAMTRMESDLRAALAALGQAAAQLSAVQATTLEQARTHILQASVSVAETILGTELSEASVAARGAVSRALGAPVPSPVHTIRLSPAVAAAAAQAGVPESITVVPDATLAPGGAVAEYQDGWLDAGIESALQRVTDTLLHEELAAL